MSDSERFLQEAHLNLGFKFSRQGLLAFLQLVFQFLTAEFEHIQSRQDHSLSNQINLSDDDQLDIATVAFIQHFGEELWPVLRYSQNNRAHLNDKYTIDGMYRQMKPTWIATTDQNCKNAGANDRSLWEDKLRSPLGVAVRKYFGVMSRLQPGELSGMVPKSQEALVAEILSVTTDD